MKRSKYKALLSWYIRKGKGESYQSHIARNGADEKVMVI